MEGCVRIQFFLINGLLLILSVYAVAQVTTADVVGRVTDTSGAVLPGVMIVIENLGTGATRSAVSSDTGDYVFNLLPPGRYSVRFELRSEERRVGKERRSQRGPGG